MAKILHVDDCPDTVDLVRNVLSRAGFDVEAEYSGLGCLSRLKMERDIDLILLDIMMPDMSGWDVFERIRKMKERPKVAFLSVLEVSPERRKALMDEGISDYITKPFEPDDLVARVSNIVGKSEGRKA